MSDVSLMVFCLRYVCFVDYGFALISRTLYSYMLQIAVYKVIRYPIAVTPVTVDH